MSEKRWALSKNMLNVLRLIRGNCQLCSDCAWCPFESTNWEHPCMLRGIPENWDLDKLEVYDEKEN
jgi:hypothetical protein